MRSGVFVLLLLLRAGSGAAQDLYLERPGEGSVEVKLGQELMKLEDALLPHRVHWQEPGEWSVPAGAWGLGRWATLVTGTDLKIQAEFVSPVSAGEEPPVGACRRCLDPKTRQVTDLVVENAVKDLLNLTLFDPGRGFMGYVEARRCSYVRDNTYRFPKARLASADGTPGLCTVERLLYWEEVLLGLRAPENSSAAPFQFRTAPGPAEVRSPVHVLRGCEATDLDLKVKGPLGPRQRVLDGSLCTGEPLDDPRLHVMLRREPITQTTFPGIGRTESFMGGN
jgi:hypothetical protein